MCEQVATTFNDTNVFVCMYKTYFNNATHIFQKQEIWYDNPMILPFLYITRLKHHSKVIVFFCFLGVFPIKNRPTFYLLFAILIIQGEWKIECRILDWYLLVSNPEMNGIHVSIQMQHAKQSNSGIHNLLYAEWQSL